MYDERMITPMRQELTRARRRGDEDRRSRWTRSSRTRRGRRWSSSTRCAAAPRATRARPCSRRWRAPREPDAITTVFAGQDTAATARARQYFTGYAPSSPSVALLKDGKLVYMLERHQIESRTADAIAKDLEGAFEKYCTRTEAVSH